MDQTGARVGYGRISTHDQNLDLQLDALGVAGCVKVFTDVASGARTDRPGLEAALEYMRPGDVLTCWKLDRVGRSTQHLVALMADLKERGFGFCSLTEQIDTSTAMGEFTFSIFAALAQLERSMIQERTRAGLAAARERGAKPGRKPSLSPEQLVVLRQLHTTGDLNISEIASVMSTSRSTVYRALVAPSSS